MEEIVINIKEVSDDELIEAIVASGQMELFGELYDRYANKVFAKAISMVNNVETARDLTQEILIKAFLSLAKFEGRSKFSTWLYMITYNYCIDHIRKEKRRLDGTSNSDEEHPDIAEEDGTEEEILQMEISKLKVLLDLLPPMDKSMLLMYYQDDMSIKDLMDHYELGESAIKMRLSRTRSKLRSLYNEKFGKS